MVVVTETEGHNNKARQPEGRMARIILIHGAWGNGASWGRLVPALAAGGHRIEALDLPGHGHSTVAPETVRQADYVAHVEQVLLAGPRAILVGHSMGGLVVAQVAARQPAHVVSCIFVAALLPRDGDSLLSLIRQQSAPGIQAAVRPGAVPGTTVLDPEAAAAVLCPDAAPAMAAKAMRALGPQPNQAQKDAAVVGPGFAKVPRAYVFCTQDRVVTPALQRQMVDATPCEAEFSLTSGHLPQLSQTEALAQIILGIATV